MNKFLLAKDKCMPEMHLKQTGFTYCACGLFPRNKKIEKFLQTGNTNFIYKNDIDKACFQHDMAYCKYKNLNKRTQSDEVLKDKAFKIASNQKYDGYQGGLASMVYSFLVLNCQTNNLQMNSTNQLLENLKEEKFILRLKTICACRFS